MNKVAVLSGDGIGPEVMAEALKVLNSLALVDVLNYSTEEWYIEILI